MNISREDLCETYGAMSTEELLDHWESGTLTELATELAAAELTQRGVALPATSPNTENADDADADTDASVPVHEAEFETVARSFVPTEMHILRGRLQADGIPAFVVDDNINQTNSLLAVATGGARLQVASEYAIEASRIIAEVKAGSRTLTDNVFDASAAELPEALPPQPAAAAASGKPASGWESAVSAAVFLFALAVFVKTMWFAHTYGADIEWNYVSLFATALPSLFFVAAGLLACRSRWASGLFCAHLPLSMALVLFFTPDDPLRADQVIGWICTVAIIVFCIHLRRAGRLA